MVIEEIKQLACEFRQALEVVSRKNLYGRLSLFRDFPNECCTFTSDLLATYLVENGVQENRIQILNSETKKHQYTHCWLMVDNSMFVDITADQFKNKPYFQKYEPISSCCIVPAGTYLYELFDKNKTNYSSFFGINSYDGSVSSELKVVYDAAIQQIEQAHKED